MVNSVKSRQLCQLHGALAERAGALEADAYALSYGRKFLKGGVTLNLPLESGAVSVKLSKGAWQRVLAVAYAEVQEQLLANWESQQKLLDGFNAEWQGVK